MPFYFAVREKADTLALSEQKTNFSARNTPIRQGSLF